MDSQPLYLKQNVQLEPLVLLLHKHEKDSDYRTP